MFELSKWLGFIFDSFPTILLEKKKKKRLVFNFRLKARLVLILSGI